MRSCNVSRVVILIALVLACVALPAMGQATAEVVGSLSNFDVVNTGNTRYNDLELFLIGPIEPECIKGWYPGWGAPPAIRAGTPRGPGVTVMWRDRRDPIEPGRSEHFGLHLVCDVPFEVRGFWSIDGRPAQEIPIPWQSWRVDGSQLWDVIRLSEEAEVDPITVVREFVTLPMPVELEVMNWKEIDRVVKESRRE